METHPENLDVLGGNFTAVGVMSKNSGIVINMVFRAKF